MPSSSRRPRERYDESNSSDSSERSSLDGQFELPGHSRSRSGRHQEQPRRSGRRSRSRSVKEQVERSLPSSSYEPSGPYARLRAPPPTHSRASHQFEHMEIDDTAGNPHATTTPSGRRRSGGGGGRMSWLNRRARLCGWEPKYSTLISIVVSRSPDIFSTVCQARRADTRLVIDSV